MKKAKGYCMLVNDELLLDTTRPTKNECLLCFYKTYVGIGFIIKGVAKCVKVNVNTLKHTEYENRISSILS